jgi:hypothetical protein
VINRHPQRQAFCLGSAYVALGDSREALIECQRALDLYRQAPAEQRWYAAEASASVDLASAYLLVGDASGAGSALTSIFSLPADKRVEGLIKRIAKVRVALAAVEGRDAGELAERIEQFSHDSIIRALPARN